MLKDITVVDYQGREKRAHANYSDENTESALQKKRVQSLKIEYILIKGEIIYPTLDWVFNSLDGSSYYIK
ncbi:MULTISPECIES: hypothetical protein [Acinetobacter]|uniref:Uncharacterized protein n=1 Tax=Acinetobacter modestus TaxID=1776740 RepID=N9NQ31_9GAMM|nr:MULTISPECIES: hypothetical protein [Acinetobacter]OJU84833.1 MAG: hypothetical protein BGN93_21285 [Acinetobacter sp. 39-4]OJU90370.1 MAG: hypothetical protein BGO19_14685 [Acinetobacter sp. 38-8]ENX04025.1 hypothetical protein F900_00516 [Acinetobacter modestus]KKW82102.1 hypothetical protein AAV96_01830 [Acinetobacter sp. AG1]NNP68055.1 hypothetical protein [Acinetobacter sp. Ac_5812]